MIKEIVIDIDGKDVKLSKEKALKLRNDLNELFGKDNYYPVYPTYPYDPWRTVPNQWDMPVITCKTYQTTGQID
jgi:hypothetical protein